MRTILLVYITAFLLASISFAHVRNVTANGDDILTVRAALGIATIIQLPETIQSAIIGDQSGFKIEYLDRAVTIKPLRFGVKTNLYLVTEKRRYNIRLVTLNQDSADYIVYIKHPELAKITTKWVSVDRYYESDGYRLSIVRIGISSGGFILLDAKISSSSSEVISVKAEDFWIKQNDTSKVINGLFLSELKLSKSKPIMVGISLAKSDLVFKKPITIEVRAKQKLSLTLSEELLWK